ncbi:MAG: hypothetical protein M1838_002849 [Thelocarpon superellum]|nr:MAG: hypothetical protein M1838_002849 [Thelocarpon superellum]
MSISTSVASLKTRLTQLSDAQRTTASLITRLSKLPIQPGSSALDSEADDARLELGSEIHQRLKEQDEALELLRQAVDDLPSPSLRTRPRGEEGERAALEIGVNRVVEDLKNARSLYRKAQLQAKRDAEKARRKERELLFADVQEGSLNRNSSRRRGQDKLSQDELVVGASQDVTAALRRTHQLMQSELSRSQFARETLEQSTAALGTLSESYSSLDTLLASSRSLLGNLLRSQKSDTWYLETAFYLLLSTIIWLIFRRFFYGPLWWLVYLPLRILFRLSSTVLFTAFGIFGSSQASLSASSSSSLASSGTSLIVKPSATPGSFPRFEGGAPAAAVAVGGGGKEDNLQSESLLEEVGRISEAAEQAAGGALEKTPQEEEQGQPNPKKRMWEEKEGETKKTKDEL